MLKDNDGNPIRTGTKGISWITDKYGGKKIADVEIMGWNDYRDVALSKEGNELDWKKVLEKHVEDSGFTTVEDWIEVIKRFCHGSIPTIGYLYHVELIGKRKPLNTS
jgi:hypothetical protein